MRNENLRKLVQFRINQVEDALRAAHVLLGQHFHRDAVNRSYYGMFYAVLALLVTKQMSTSKHQGAISLFDREFARPGIFGRELSYWLHEALEMCLDADYAELVDVPEEEAQRILDNARIFISQVKSHLTDWLADTGDAETPQSHQ